MFETGTKMSLLIHFSSTLWPKFFSFSFLSSTNQLFPFSKKFSSHFVISFFISDQMYSSFLFCVLLFFSLVKDESWRRGRWVRISVNFQMYFWVMSNVFLSLVKCISKSGQMYFCVWWWLLVEDESWRRGRWVRISVNFHQLDTVKGGRGVQMIFIVFSTNFFSTYRLIEFIHRHLGY